MKTVNADLIYDVGLFDGEDTAFYLFRGYRVVAVDANPLMIEAARSRFAKEVSAKRLTLVNAGVGQGRGEATFWVSDKGEWSSFDRAIASRDATGHRPVAVPVVPFSGLLEEHGIPQYLKIDIEGADRLCVEALKGKKLPKYISVEAECVGDTDVLSDEQAIVMLELLRDAGYRRFKLVNQTDWLPVRSKVSLFRYRLVTGSVHGRLRFLRLSRVAAKYTDPARIASLGFPFSVGSSTGPWGNDIPGGWMTFQQAKSVYLEKRHSFFSHKESLYSFWYDWHATY
jgi:FkbM family methyltransferase